MKGTKPQTVQTVRQGEPPPYWFLLIHYIRRTRLQFNPFELRDGIDVFVATTG
ncbi:transposase [Neisseria meningitidis]|nr:transposase [Neisseria meningitidis]